MPRKNKKNKKRNTPASVAQSLQRKLAKQHGFYDGRFRSRAVRDKKKERNRKLARKKVIFSED